MGLPQCFHSTCPEEQFWKKTSKNIVFHLSFLEVEQTISACCRNFFNCCQNCILGVPRNMSGKKFLFSKIKVSYLFRTISEPFPAFIQDIFVTISKIAFHLSIGTVWGKQIRKKNMIFSSFSDNVLKKKWPVVKHFEQASSKQQSTRPRVRKVFLVKKKVKPFPDIQPKFIGHLSQSLRRGCQNWIQHKQRILSRENLLFLRSYTFFIKILLWVNKSQPSCIKLLSDWSKNCIS